MKKLISTALLTASAFTLATATASAQAQIWTLPLNFDSFHMSPDGIFVSGTDGNGQAQLWNPTTMVPAGGPLTDFSFAGAVSMGGQFVVGRYEDPVTLVEGPGFYQFGVGDTMLGFPPLYSDGCTLTSTANSISWDGSTIGGTIVNGCNAFPFRWTTTGGYQILDTSSLIVPSAQPSAKALATSGDGNIAAGWIQTSSRSGAVWDAAGVLSFPMITAGNPEGNGEIYGMDFDGSTIAGNSYSNGPVVIKDGTIHKVALEAGLNKSGEGMLSVSGDGNVAVGNGGGQPGPFGSPDTGLVWTSWGGGQDINTLFGAYGVVLPTGNPVARAVEVSSDGHTFLVQEAPAFFGYGDSFLVQLPNSWSDLGGASVGSNGTPVLDGMGFLTPGAPVRIEVSNAASNSLSFVAVSGTDSPFPIWGGVLHTLSYSLLVPVPTDGIGTATLNLSWPIGFAPGATVYIQAVTVDAGAADGLTLTNAVSAMGF